MSPGSNTAIRVEHLKVVGDAEGKKGTEVRFLASTETFSNLDYEFKTLENRLRELAFLNSGVRIILEDERPAEPLHTELHLRRRGAGIRQIPRPAQDRRCCASRST